MKIGTGIGIAAFTGLAIYGAAIQKHPPASSAIAAPATSAAVHPKMAPPAPSPPPSAWTATTIAATFGTGERAIMAPLQTTISRTGQRQQRDGTITVTRSQAWVVTGDPFICRSIPNNDVEARWAIGSSPPRADRWLVSTDSRAIFASAAFRRALLDAKQPALVEVVDSCGRVTVVTVPVDGITASAQAAGLTSTTARVSAPVPIRPGR